MVIITAKATIQVLKPAEEVFEAIVNPEKMSHFFIAGSTGRLEKGKTVMWHFPEFPDAFPVTAKTITPCEYISFDWSGGMEGMLVEISLEAGNGNATVVRVTERERPHTEQGIQWAIQQTEGWANFLACMKAWLEYGVHLRKGAFDFMKQP